jgi:hypothetical protein
VVCPDRDANRRSAAGWDHAIFRDAAGHGGAAAIAVNAGAVTGRERPARRISTRRNDVDGCGQAASYSLLNRYSHERRRMSRSAILG